MQRHCFLCVPAFCVCANVTRHIAHAFYVNMVLSQRLVVTVQWDPNMTVYLEDMRSHWLPIEVP